MGWFGGIFEARESKDEELSDEGPDGNYTYDKSGTYGQSDFTVREREDGTSDVYISSDSDRGHSHDHIDAEGNLHIKLSARIMLERKNVDDFSRKLTL